LFLLKDKKVLLNVIQLKVKTADNKEKV
jgi:hypothetical protein